MLDQTLAPVLLEAPGALGAEAPGALGASERDIQNGGPHKETAAIPMLLLRPRGSWQRVMANVSNTNAQSSQHQNRTVGPTCRLLTAQPRVQWIGSAWASRLRPSS